MEAYIQVVSEFVVNAAIGVANIFVGVDADVVVDHVADVMVATVHVVEMMMKIQ